MSVVVKTLTRVSNAPLVILAVILIMAGLVSLIPLGQVESIARLVIAVIAAVAGIYVIYHGLMTRSKIDDFIAAIFGMLLLGIAAYLGFGFNLVAMFSQYVSAVQSALPYIIGAVMALAGIALTARSGISRFIGIFLIMGALALLGVNLIQLIKWW